MRKCIGVYIFLTLLIAFAGDSYAYSEPPQTYSFTYWMPVPGAASGISMMDNGIFAALEERTGVHIEFIHPPPGQETMQYNLMLAANELTDFLCDDSVYYSGSPDRAFAEGIYIPVEELVYEYSPNLRAIYEDNPNVLNQMTTVQGHIWGYGKLVLAGDNEIGYSTGPAIRQDWLDELGLSMPVTIADWHAVLTAFKEEKGAAAPLILNKSGIPAGGGFLSAFGIAPGFYLKDGKVMYGPWEPEFKQYLELMRDWYVEGLLDRNFASTAADSDGYYGYMTEGISGAIDDVSYGLLAAYDGVKPAPHPGRGDTLRFNYSYEVARDSRSYITGNCPPEKYAAAALWWDYLYSDEGFGMISAARAEDSGWNAKNPYAPEWGFIGGRVDLLALPGGGGEIAREAWNVWASDDEYTLPQCDIPAGYSDEFNALIAEIDEYREQMTLKFILGVEPLENFDKYISALGQLNIARVIEIKQIAYDIYARRQGGAEAVSDEAF